MRLRAAERTNGGMCMSNIRYFACYSKNGVLVNVGTVNTFGNVNGEITAEEYAALKATIPEPEPAETVSEADEALKILSGEVTE